MVCARANRSLVTGRSQPLQTKAIEDLARALIERKTVSFSFFDVARPGERISVTIRFADEWDAGDAEAERYPPCVVGEDLVIASPRAREAVVQTALRFEDRISAGQAVIEAWRSISGLE